MRRIAERPDLPANTLEVLADKTRQISESQEPLIEALRVFNSARSSAWFKPVINTLRSMSGPGGCCMFCSRSESSDVEHYRPKSVFPEYTMDWRNFLWSCAICNRNKGDQFPPHTIAGGMILNPIDDDPWNFLYLDDIGRVYACLDKNSNELHPRAISTIGLLKLNREDLLASRQIRYDDLRERVEACIAGFHEEKLTRANLETSVEKFLLYPFHSDVADYFLNGPGRSESPFRELFELLAD